MSAGSWFVDKVLPGMITGVPYVVIGGAGLWFNWRKTVDHVKKVTDDQTQQLSQQLTAEHERHRRGGRDRS